MDPVQNIPIPEDVKIKRPQPEETGGAKTTASASVTGDQSLMVIDVLQSRPVKVFVLEAKPYLPEDDGRLVFVQGPVSSELVPYENAKSRFAVKPDGTVIYNARGFDDVRAGADFDLVDIVKLIEHNHGAGAEARQAEAA